MLYLPGADTLTYLAEMGLDKFLIRTAVQVKDSYTSGDHQAAADYGRRAIMIKDTRESISKFASNWFPLHMLPEKQKQRREMLNQF